MFDAARSQAALHAEGLVYSNERGQVPGAGITHRNFADDVNPIFAQEAPVRKV